MKRACGFNLFKSRFCDKQNKRSENNFEGIVSKTFHSLALVLLFAILLSGCVPLKQFNDLEEANKELSSEVDDLSSSNELLEGRNEELKALADKLKDQVSELTADTLQKSRELNGCRDDLQKKREEYNQLLSQLRDQTGAESSEELLEHLQQLQEDLQEREDSLIQSERTLEARKRDLEKSEAELSRAKADLEETREELESKNQRLIELEEALAQKDSASNALRKAVSDALMGFDQDQLQVHIKNGKVYVSMEEKLLFGSGSYQVSSEGASALREVGKVLADQKDINIMIEGHTDPVPYQSGRLLDNWDLSVKRATSVTRILLENTEIEPSRVIAAGRGPHVPVTSNDSEAGRRKNRRTEIILTPKLEQVLDILETH
ncbi:MAG: OmpA family protein [Marinilabiliaceae bacterium]